MRTLFGTSLRRAALVVISIGAAVAALAGSERTGLEADRLRQIQERIAESEYHVTWQIGNGVEASGAAWQAPNRAQGLRTYFEPDGIRVVPRMEEIPSWQWGLSWIGYGRDGQLWALPPATLTVNENRANYSRDSFEEWYENGPRGVKQGFMLAVPPEALGARGRPATRATLPAGRGKDPDARSFVHLDLALTGGLSALITADGQSAEFVTETGVRVLRYDELIVTDVRDRVVPAWMEGFVSGPDLRGVRLVLDVRDAVWPVTIDPLATSPGWTAESNQANAEFGLSVATAGDVNGDGFSDVIVGAHLFDNGQNDEGRAFLYHGSPSGVALTPAWTAESNQAGARFGRVVATAGDVNGDGYADVLVGAPLFDNGQTDEGRAFVYLGSISGLGAIAAWTAESNQANAQFGLSVATAGDVNGDGFSDVIVGAPLYDNGQTDEGRAYLYLGSPTGPGAGASWTAESNQGSANFGASLATAGDVNGDGYADVIVGAFLYDNGQTDEGRAYVYHGSVSGLASSAAWTAESNQASANFGFSVSTAGDVNADGYSDVIVGARLYDNGQTDEGRAYGYHGSASGLGTTAVWTAESNQAGANFGYAVATAGDTNGDGYSDVIVGSPLFDGGQTDEGRAILYAGSPAGLSTTAVWTAESDQAGANFGIAVATAGDVNGDGYSDVIVGANLDDNGETNEGRVYVFNGSPSGLSTAADWTGESDQANAQFALSVATAGDVNGDGYADVIVGAPFYDNGQTDEGRAFVYQGTALGLAVVPAWTAEGDQANARFGYAVATAGDVNGDGYDDVIVGAPLYDNGQTDEGRAFIYHGSLSGLAVTEAWTAESNQANAQFGLAVATAGDVNDDGFADAIVGAPLFDNGHTDEGRAFVYHGSTLGLGAEFSWTAESDQSNANFGVAVSSAGDVNRDGYSDVIVGASLFDNGQNNEGRAFVYHGATAGLSVFPSWTAESDQSNANFGLSLATAGDVNGDGFADVVVGAYLYDNGQNDEGRAYVYLGSVSGLAASAAWTVESGQASANFGFAVSSAGDVNGDGYADVIVGAPLFDNGQNNEGRAYVFHGSATGLGATASWTAESDQANANFGVAVSGAGDVNGDGYSDAIVGARLFDNGQTDEGRGFVYYGNGGRGVTLLPRQLRVNGPGPIAHLGMSDVPSGFRLGLHGRTPFGRGRVKLESEVKPLGQTFDGLGTRISILPSDTDTTGVPIEDLVSGLTSGRYHWRVRLRYHPAATPFAPASRWLTIPWGGWQEAMLRTNPCMPADPPIEVCNGVDDDCNGLIDDGIVPQTTNCGVGACARTGETTCAGGAPGDTCTPGFPVPELCNGIDDDCNGATDENGAALCDDLDECTADSCDLGTCRNVVTIDADFDGVCDLTDNCPGIANPSQADGDVDAIGDACDNCPSVANPDQSNADRDALGDACDSWASQPLFFVDTPFDPPADVAIYTVNPATGALALRANLGTAYGPALALAAADGSVLYAVGSDNTGGTICQSHGFACLLLRIELDPISTTPRSVTVVGPLRVGGQQLDDITGLNFRNNGALYAISQTTNGLYVIDRQTAQATLAGTANTSLHGGDLAFDSFDRLWVYINSGTPSTVGFYRMNPETAQVTLVQASSVNFSGLAGQGHSNVMYGVGATPDRIWDVIPASGATGAYRVLTLNGSTFDHKRGDLDSPFCESDASCEDNNPCSLNRCTPGGCEFIFPSTDGTCDGIDDDCDGQFDEDFVPSPTTCGVGACVQIGQTTCADGVPGDTCTPGTPTGEVCNGIDDDCDGQVDEDTLPPEVATDLLFDDPSSLVWTATPGVPRYNLYRGTMTGAAWSYDHTCVQAASVSSNASDPAVPQVGTGFYYLVAGASDCGEGGVGTASGGAPRPKPSPCP